MVLEKALDGVDDSGAHPAFLEYFDHCRMFPCVESFLEFDGHQEPGYFVGTAVLLSHHVAEEVQAVVVHKSGRNPVCASSKQGPVPASSSV